MQCGLPEYSNTLCQRRSQPSNPKTALASQLCVSAVANGAEVKRLSQAEHGGRPERRAPGAVLDLRCERADSLPMMQTYVFQACKRARRNTVQSLGAAPGRSGKHSVRLETMAWDRT